MTHRSRVACILGHAPVTIPTEEGQPVLMAAETKAWTLEELHRLPDDGNKYELVRGELFVTPPPKYPHEAILARLTRLLDPYVAEHRLGHVYHPRSVVRFEDSEVEPDLFVGPEPPDEEIDWADAPTPILVVEVVSRSTRRRDHGPKRDFYIDAGVPTYWIVDRDSRTIKIIEAGKPDRTETSRASWWPTGASAPFELEVSRIFK